MKCPCCQPPEGEKSSKGSVWRYKGVDSVLRHARCTSWRWASHRRLAAALEGLLAEHGISVATASCGGAADVARETGLWEALPPSAGVDGGVVMWPPTVIFCNTASRTRGSSGMFSGISPDELRVLHKELKCINGIKESFGPQGYRGMTAVQFKASMEGLAEAEDLADMYERKGRGRSGFMRRPVRRVGHTGKLLLYAYMANKSDLDMFNRGRRTLKATTKSRTDIAKESLSALEEAKRKQREAQESLEIKRSEIARLQERAAKAASRSRQEIETLEEMLCNQQMEIERLESALAELQSRERQQPQENGGEMRAPEAG